MEKTNTLTTQLSKWVKDARLYAGFSQESLGEILGRTKQNVWNMENEKHEPSYSQLMLIAQATKFPKPFPGLERSIETIPNGYIELTYYDIQSSAGPGSVVDYQPAVSKMLVLEDWAREYLKTTTPKNIRIITNKGVSMYPTINDGDLLFVDVSCNRYDGDGIYIILDDEELKTKRLIKEDGIIRIISDNPAPAYKEKTVTAKNQHSLMICGKVRRYFSLKDAT